MFWDKKVQIREIEYLAPPPPPKKAFITMMTILKDAEKFDSKDEKEVSDATLKNLCDFINRYIESGKIK